MISCKRGGSVLRRSSISSRTERCASPSLRCRLRLLKGTQIRASSTGWMLTQGHASALESFASSPGWATACKSAIASRQDGDGTPWDALLRMQRCNVCGDGSIFCFYRRKPKESGLHALCLRLEILGNAIRIPFRDAIFVALNDRGSSMENRLATAKTFRKSDSNRVRKTLKESDHILHACPLKPVDRLIVVSDDAEIGLMRCNDIPCEKIEYLILCAVQVLKLISNHILILLLQTDQQPFMLPQHLERHQDHVIGVVAMGAPQRIDVTTVDGNEFLKLLRSE